MSDGGGSWQPDVLESTLRDLGYDVDPPRHGDLRARGVVARRDLGDRVVLLAVDGGGRFRIEVTWVVNERSGGDEIAGVAVRVVDTMTRALTIAGQVDEPMRVVDVVAALETLGGPANAVASALPTPPAPDSPK